MSEIKYVKDTFEAYLGKKDHISSSDVKNFLHSPAYYYYMKYGEKKEKKQGRHFALGSAMHEVIMEPHKFKSHYAVSQTFDRRTAKGKKDYAKFEKKNKGKIILFENEMDMITEIGINALNNPTLLELIRDSYKELSIYTVDAKTGLKIRLRPDIFCKTKSTIVDFKSTTESSKQSFKGDVYKFGYSITDAFYKHFSQKENYIFCAMEKEPPYQVTLFGLNDEMIEYGKKSFRMGLDLIKWSYDNNYWCDYAEFEILKECYELNNLDKFLEINKTASRIIIL